MHSAFMQRNPKFHHRERVSRLITQRIRCAIITVQRSSSVFAIEILYFVVLVHIMKGLRDLRKCKKDKAKESRPPAQNK